MPERREFDLTQAEAELGNVSMEDLNGEIYAPPAAEEQQHPDAATRIAAATGPQPGEAQQPAPADGQPSQQQAQAQQQGQPPQQPPANDWNSLANETWKRTLPNGQVREYKGFTPEQIRGYVGLGLNAAEKGKELNQQLQEFQQQQQTFQQQYQQQAAQLEEQYAPIKQFEQWMNSDPAFKQYMFNAVEAFKQGAQQAPLDPQLAQAQQPAYNPQLSQIQQQVQQLSQKSAQWEQYQQAQQSALAQARFDAEVNKLAQANPQTDFDLPDSKDGVSLRDRIASTIQEKRIRSNTAAEDAYRIIRYSDDMALARQGAMQQAAQNFQQKHALAVQAPGQNGAPNVAQQSAAHLRGKSIEQIMASPEVMADFSNDSALATW